MKINPDNLKGSFEPTILKELQAKQRKFNYTFEYEPDALEYIISHWYIPDWKIHTANNKIIYIESKGYFTSKDRTKALKTKEQHPDLDIRFIFQKDNKIHKASNTRYSDWCKKHNFLFSIGIIPEEWFNE